MFNMDNKPLVLRAEVVEVAPKYDTNISQLARDTLAKIDSEGKEPAYTDNQVEALSNRYQNRQKTFGDLYKGEPGYVDTRNDTLAKNSRVYKSINILINSFTEEKYAGCHFYDCRVDIESVNLYDRMLLKGCKFLNCVINIPEKTYDKHGVEIKTILGKNHFDHAALPNKHIGVSILINSLTEEKFRNSEFYNCQVRIESKEIYDRISKTSKFIGCYIAILTEDTKDIVKDLYIKPEKSIERIQPRSCFSRKGGFSWLKDL